MDRKELVDNIMIFLPELHKKLFNGLHINEMTKQQLEFMHRVKLEPENSMSYYASKMCLLKSNLTVLVDKLYKDGMLERHKNLQDRRITLLKLTDKGNRHLREAEVAFKRELSKKFEKFNAEDIQRLSELFFEVRKIFMKIKDDERGQCNES